MAALAVILEHGLDVFVKRDGLRRASGETCEAHQRQQQTQLFPSHDSAFLQLQLGGGKQFKLGQILCFHVVVCDFCRSAPFIQMPVRSFQTKNGVKFSSYRIHRLTFVFDYRILKTSINWSKYVRTDTKLTLHMWHIEGEWQS